MKMRVLQRHIFLSWAISTILFLMLLVSLIAVSGCGLGDPEAELDRVPNVPPSTRGAEGGAVFDPTGR